MRAKDKYILQNAFCVIFTSASCFFFLFLLPHKTADLIGSFSQSADWPAT